MHSGSLSIYVFISFNSPLSSKIRSQIGKFIFFKISSPVPLGDFLLIGDIFNTSYNKIANCVGDAKLTGFSNCSDLDLPRPLPVDFVG